MNKDFETAFIYGYMYAKAEDMKNKGLFKELDTKDIIKIIVKTFKN